MKPITVIERLLKFGNEEIRKDFRPDCCIAGTRIALNVLDYFGIAAQPLPVEYLVMNEAFAKLAFRLKRPPTKEEQDAVGGWAVGVDTRPSETGFGGHVVTVVKRLLVDLTVNQANRPHKHINLPSGVAVELPKAFWQGGSAVTQAGDSVLSYRLLASPADFTTAPDWYDATRHSAALRIIRRIEQNR